MSKEDFPFRLSRLNRRWRRALDERLQDLGLTQSRWVTLLYIDRLGGNITQRELAEAMAIEAPTLVRFIAGLEKDGLIVRQSCPEDRRANRVSLSAQGEAFLEQLNSRASAMREQVMAGISPRELDICLSVFERLQNNLETLNSPLSFTATGGADSREGNDD